MQTISQDEFKKLTQNMYPADPFAPGAVLEKFAPAVRPLTPPQGLTTELRWFKHNEMLGLILIDNVDHDYSWVVLERDPSKVYRCIANGVSCPSMEAAIKKLTETLETI